MKNTDLYVTHKIANFNLDENSTTVRITGTCKQKNPIMTVDVGGDEILRFESNGDIFVHGRLSANDKEVVDGFREFLSKTNFI